MCLGTIIAEPLRDDATVEGGIIVVDDVDNSSSRSSKREDEEVDETAV